MAQLRTAYMYKWYCKSSPDIYYVGSTWDMNARKQSHKIDIKKLYHEKKYVICEENGGWECFEFDILEEYPSYNNNERFMRERYWFDELEPVMNTNRPYITEEERKKMWIEKSKEWCETYPEKAKEKSKKYYENNSEKCKEQSKKYYQNNTEKCKEQAKKYSKKYYENHSEKGKEQSKKYRKNNLQQMKQRQKDWYKRNSKKHTCLCRGSYTTTNKKIHNKSSHHLYWISKGNNRTTYDVHEVLNDIVDSICKKLP